MPSTFLCYVYIAALKIKSFPCVCITDGANAGPAPGIAPLLRRTSPRPDLAPNNFSAKVLYTIPSRCHLIDSCLGRKGHRKVVFSFTKCPVQREIASQQSLGVENLKTVFLDDEKQSLRATAEEVFGSRETATRWFRSKAIGLDGSRPVDLLRSRAGRERVRVFLVRLDYGVYC